MYIYIYIYWCLRQKLWIPRYPQSSRINIRPPFLRPSLQHLFYQPRSTQLPHQATHIQNVHVSSQTARSRRFHQCPRDPRPHQAKGLRAIWAWEVHPHSLLYQDTFLVMKAHWLITLLMGGNRQALRYAIRNTALPQRVRAQAQLQLAQMHAYTRSTQIKNRCVAGGIARGVFRAFRLGRVCPFSHLLFFSHWLGVFVRWWADFGVHSINSVNRRWRVSCRALRRRRGSFSTMWWVGDGLERQILRYKCVWMAMAISIVGYGLVHTRSWLYYSFLWRKMYIRLVDMYVNMFSLFWPFTFHYSGLLVLAYSMIH